MSKQFVNCQLPGCTTVIAVSLDEPTPRKYCCAEHRVAARRLRHETLAGNGQPVTVPAPSEVVRVGAAKPTPRPRPVPTAPVRRPIANERAWQGVSVNRQSLQRGAELGRRYARRGIELGHRSARQGLELGARAASRSVELGRVASATVVPGCRHCRQQLAHGLAELRTSWRGATQRQRRAVAALGFLAVMLTGSGWIAALAIGDGSSSNQVAAPPMTSVAAPHGMAAWAKQATVDLTAVQSQLTEVGKGESAWNALPTSAQTGDLANSYAQLERQKNLLRQEQAMLQSGLNAVTSVQQTSKTIDDVEGQLKSVTTMVAGMPPAEQGDIAQNAIHGQLLQQQDVLQQECSTLHQELAGWVAAVQVALATGLPDSTDTTISTVNLIIAAGQPPAPAPPAPVPAPTVVLADGPTARSRQDVTSSAPPRHHGSSSGSPRGSAPAASVPGLGNLGGLEQIGFGIVHDVLG